MLWTKSQLMWAHWEQIVYRPASILMALGYQANLGRRVMEWFHKLLPRSKYDSYSMSPKHCEDDFIEPPIEISPPLVMGLVRGPSNTFSPHFLSVFQITILQVYRI